MGKLRQPKVDDDCVPLKRQCMPSRLAASCILIIMLLIAILEFLTTTCYLSLLVVMYELVRIGSLIRRAENTQ